MRDALVFCLTLLFVLAAAAACGDDDPDPDNNDQPNPDVGASDVDVGVSDADAAAPDAPVDQGEYDMIWTELVQEYGCSGSLCHGSGMGPAVDEHDLVVGVESECDGSLIVDPGNPEGSLLWQKMTPEIDEDDVCGSKMPLVTGASAEDAQMVWDWIEAGAPE